MADSEAVQITDASGLSFEAWLEPSNAPDTPHVRIELADGQQVVIPRELLVAQSSGRYLVNVSLREYVGAASPPQQQNESEAVIRLAEERLSVGKQRFTSGRVRVTKRVSEQQETVDIATLHEAVSVKRVPFNKPVEQAVLPYTKGDTTIIPLYEEVLVVSKQLVLVEEVWVTRQQTERRDPQQVTLRREEAVIERDTLNKPDTSDNEAEDQS